MEKFSIASRNSSKALRQAARWVEMWVCGISPKQGVVGSRRDWGLIVTQEMADRGGRPAQVCPFVADSLDRDLFWMEESDLTVANDIKRLLRNQIPAFVSAQPAHNPMTGNVPARLPELWKTFLTIFPQVQQRSTGGMPLFDAIHADLKTDFMKNGLMLGQFYQGCPQEGIHSANFKPLGIAPWPCFAIRYMASHDYRFFDRTNVDHEQAFLRYFPGMGIVPP